MGWKKRKRFFFLPHQHLFLPETTHMRIHIETHIHTYFVVLCIYICVCVRFSFSYFLKFILFIYLFFWLCWVSAAALRLSLVASSGGYSSLQCTGFSLRWLLLLQSTGSRRASFSSCGTQAQQLWLTGSRAQSPQLWHTGSVAVAHRLQSTGSVVVAHRPSCSVACGIFLDQGSNPHPPHQQADS